VNPHVTAENIADIGAQASNSAKQHTFTSEESNCRNQSTQL